RHTRSKRDWSSDVCSSDLYIKIPTKHLGNIIIEDVDMSVRRTAINAIDKIQTANSIYLEIIKPEIIKTLGLFGEDDENSLSCSRSEERRVGKECGSREAAC